MSTGAMAKAINVAVVGATGAVGRELLALFEERKFPAKKITAFASSRSEGKELSFRGEKLSCQILKAGCFQNIDLVFFDASDAISQEWVPQAAQAGAWVVDNSASFRLDPEVPLIVPEVNGGLLSHPNKKIISGPNCTVAPMTVVLNPILRNWGIKRVVLCTYQSVSGAGTLAMQELTEQSLGFLSKKSSQSKVFPHPIAFNCIPQIGAFKTGPYKTGDETEGYTSEEVKTLLETRKILGKPGLKLTTTAIRVPTFSCHGQALNIECERAFDLTEIRKALLEQPGLTLEDDPKTNLYPMGVRQTGKDSVSVGRIRRDFSVENGLNLWIVSDNLRKGAALNAIQIGEILVGKYF